MKRDLRRLTELVNVVLPQVKDEEFNLFSWKSESNCGTVACAVGHACLHPPFQKAGLSLSFYEIPYPIYNGVTGTSAVAQFFNLSAVEVEDLFFVQSYPNRKDTTKQEVMQRIKEMLATNSSSES